MLDIHDIIDDFTDVKDDELKKFMIEDAAMSFVAEYH